jgi:hypothetical protein
MAPLDTDVHEETGLDALGDMMGEMAPAEFEDETKEPTPDDASPEAAPEDGPPPSADAPKVQPDDEQEPEDANKGDDDADDGEDDLSEEEEMAQLAGPLTHDQVRESPSFKGVLGELATTRAELKATRERLAEAEANGVAVPDTDAPEEDPHGALFDAEDDDDDIDTMTKGERKAMMEAGIKKGIEEALAPIQAERQAGASIANARRDIAAMQADPSIPDGLKLTRLCLQARQHMAEHSPGLLKSINGKPGMSRELFNYGVLRVPSVQQAVTAARSTQTDDTKTRVLRGQEVDTEPAEFWELMGGDDSPEE